MGREVEALGIETVSSVTFNQTFDLVISSDSIKQSSAIFYFTTTEQSSALILGHTTLRIIIFKKNNSFKC